VAFERTLQFIRLPAVAPVKVQVDGEQAEVGAVLNLVIGDGLQLTQSTDQFGVTTWTLSATP
jgi:hypothetical protein